MKTYAAQYDDDSRGNNAPEAVVLLRTDSLAAAVESAQKSNRSAYVLHVPSGLQRYVFEGRAVWLDSHGVERPDPSMVGSASQR